MTNTFRNLNLRTLRSFLCGCTWFAALVTTASAAVATSSVQVQMGSNASVGRILSLELLVNSAQLVSSKGTAVSLVSRPFTMEQSHLAASAEVVGRVAVPVGTYTKALLNVANPHVIFIDSFGNIREARWAGNSLTTVVLKQPISVNSAAQTMLRAQPAFTVSQLSPGRAGADAEVAGELEAAVGKVTSVSGSSFTVADAVSGLTTTYLTDRNTAYNGVSLRTMTNLLVRIHSTTPIDGQLLAKEVSVAGSGSGSVVTGVITDFTGTKVATQQVYGAGASSSVLGAFGTVVVDPAASFQVDSRGMDLTGINLTFGPNNMVAGQRIQFMNRGTMQNSSITGASLGQALTARLQLQTISGTVTNVAVASNGGTSFDLQLPPNDGSPLSTLGEGTGLIHIISQPLTKSSVPTLTEGTQVKVRGLLLFDAPARSLQSNAARGYITATKGSSNYYMVARTIQRDGGRRN